MQANTKLTFYTMIEFIKVKPNQPYLALCEKANFKDNQVQFPCLRPGMITARSVHQNDTEIEHVWQSEVG